ncbi:gamma-aminobutyric acid receptor subunit beta-like [Trichonephila inaurata madagascariensis]|uniref:Gamma-aminobutyric acid receptor subunit beta-like n=1 Tax=Trichonephila inaurata madagascariensis TaxID=2747483 RepID=A0A8X6XI63_9ARAC|nr:gamma-aminobutyric acid receptor subunit beta-like [Trichonephila inaurata madagascariensis]
MVLEVEARHLEDYTLTLYLNQYWQDERLAFSSETYELTLSGDFAAKIWVPDTFFANDKNSFLHDVTEKNKMVRLSSDGRIKYGMSHDDETCYIEDALHLQNFHAVVVPLQRKAKLKDTF